MPSRPLAERTFWGLSESLSVSTLCQSTLRLYKPMKHRILRISAVLLAITFVQVWDTHVTMAQRSTKADNLESDQNNWYYGSEETEPTKSIAQQKAMLRAEQRMDRLASLKWYGFQPGRPTASGMPFTTMYSPAWSRPGGRPFSWYTGYPQPIYNFGYRYW